MAGPYRYAIGPVVERTQYGLSCYGPPDSCVSWIDLRRMAEMSAPGQLGCGFFTMPSGWSIPSGYHWLGGGEGDCRSLYLTAQDQAAWLSLIGSSPTRTASTTLIDALDETLTTLADPTGDSAPKPIVPGAGEGPPPSADIILGGHSSVRRKELAIGGGWWKKLVVLHQRELDDEAARDPQDRLWRKRLGDLSRKYFGAHDDVRGNQLVSQQLKRDRLPSNPSARQADRVFARKPETSFAESFNGPDSATFGVDLTWTETLSALQTLSNQGATVAFSGHCSARAESDVSSADHYVQADVSGISTSGGASLGGVCARFSGSAQTHYATWFEPVTTRLYKIVVEAFTQLATDSVGAASSTHKLHCNGSAITAYKNGTSWAAVTDTAISSGTRGGVRGYADRGPFGLVYWDSWSISDLVPPTTRGMPLGTRSTAFNGGRTFAGNIR